MIAVNVSVTLNLDDGFLRRSCPNCNREFKWHHGPTDDRPLDAMDPPLYHCPYCGLTALSDEWLTPEQIAHIGQAIQGPMTQIVDGALIDAFNRSRTFRYKPAHREIPGPPAPPAEPTDMVIISSPCHPWEPIKVLENWHTSLHCLVCGDPFALE